MTQGVSQVSERYRRLAAEFTRRVEAVPAGRWESPSPCAGWTARDVLRHIIDVHRSMPGYAGLTVELRKSAAEDPVGAWLEARDAMQEILEDPARARLEYDGYFGRTTLEQTVDRFLCFDLLITPGTSPGPPAGTRRCRWTRSAGCTRRPSASGTRSAVSSSSALR